MSKVKYICFDIGGVACYGAKKERVAMAQSKWNISEEGLSSMLHPNIGDGVDYWRELQNGEIPADVYLSAAVKGLNLEDTQENRDHFRACMVEWGSYPYEPTIELAKRLGEEGFHVSVLTNNNELTYTCTSSSKIVEHASVAVSSHEIGVCKPKEKAYESLLEGIGNPDPKEVLFIDDMKRNIIGAEKVGLNGFLFPSQYMQMDDAFGELVTYMENLRLINPELRRHLLEH